MAGTANIPLTYIHKGIKRRTHITATHKGGSYIDLSFGGAHPSEVINVWDHQAGKSRLTGKRGEVKAILTEWIKDEDDYERSYQDEGDKFNRNWLRLYVENS